MAKLTIKDYITTLGLQQSYDIINAIRNEASPSFKQYVPLASATNIAEVGAGVLLSQQNQNEFITSLVDRIGLFVLRTKTMQNILSKFKKGTLPLGSKIEETYIDLVKAKVYNPYESETTVFKREIPDVKTLFHETNRQELYKSTIQDSSLQKAFISYADFDNFLAGIINAMYNSNEVDEFHYMKLLLDAYYANGQFVVVPIDAVTTEQTAKDFIKKARATVTKMTLPTGSRNYNALAVHTRTAPEDLAFIVDADLMATVDVDVLARAFNIDRTTFLGNVVIIDNFASTGLRACAVDSDFFMVYDQVFKMETIRNPQGLYWNYNLHVWQIMSASRFSNAVAFVEGSVPAVTNVVLSPPLSNVAKGSTKEFEVYIRKTTTVATTTTVEFVGAKNAGTTATVQANGNILLTVASAETNPQLTLKVNVSYGSTPTVVSSQAVVLVS